jgi:hypothetical protein
MKVNNISFLLLDKNQWDEVFVNSKYGSRGGNEIITIKNWKLWIKSENCVISI